jgi:hypothetical protein
VTNNVVYDFGNGGSGITTAGRVEIHAYNNTVVGCVTGIRARGATSRVFNNIVQDSVGSAYENVVDEAATGSNIADDGTSPDGDEFNGQSVSFEAAASGDFRLAPDDMAARDRGVDLSDEPFAPTTDILGRPRPDRSWDIGAFEMDP